MTQHPDQHGSGSGRSWRKVAMFAAVAIIALYLTTMERRPDVAGLLYYLPYLLLLACPLMHLFHRHGHGDHERHRREGAEGAERRA